MLTEEEIIGTMRGFDFSLLFNILFESDSFVKLILTTTAIIVGELMNYLFGSKSDLVIVVANNEKFIRVLQEHVLELDIVRNILVANRLTGKTSSGGT